MLSGQLPAVPFERKELPWVKLKELEDCGLPARYWMPDMDPSAECPLPRSWYRRLQELLPKGQGFLVQEKNNSYIMLAACMELIRSLILSRSNPEKIPQILHGRPLGKIANVDAACLYNVWMQGEAVDAARVDAEQADVLLISNIGLRTNAHMVSAIAHVANRRFSDCKVTFYHCAYVPDAPVYEVLKAVIPAPALWSLTT